MSVNGANPKGTAAKTASGTFVEARHHEFAVAERFRSGEASVDGAEHHVDELVAGLVHGDFALQEARGIDVDVLAHRAHRARVGGDLDHRQYRIADDIALAGRKEMDNEARGRAQRGHLRRGRRAVHEPQSRPRGHLGLVDHAVDDALPADFLDVAEGLFLDRGQTSGDIVFGRLRIREVGRLVAVDDLLIAIEDALEVGAHLVVAAACGDDVLAAGELGRLAENERATHRVELVESIAHGRIGAATRRRIRFAALGRDPQLIQRAFVALRFTRQLQIFPGGLGRAHDSVVVSVQLDAEAGDRLARRGDAVDDFLGPAFLDADDDDRGDVRIASGADQRPEVQIEVGAELQSTVRVRNGHRALDVVGHRFGCRIGQIVHGKDDDVVANADATVLSPVTPKTVVHGAQTPKNAKMEIDAVVRDLRFGSGTARSYAARRELTSAWS